MAGRGSTHADVMSESAISTDEFSLGHPCNAGVGRGSESDARLVLLGESDDNAQLGSDILPCVPDFER
jgi:hypothetical protein